MNTSATTPAAEYRPAAPQRSQSQMASISTFLKQITPEIARSLPKGMDADRVARIVYTEVRKSVNAKEANTAKYSLLDCTRESFAAALLTSSALGLEPGVQGECNLVPYEDRKRNVVECQLIIGYQGVVKLFWNHPRAQGIKCEAIFSNDTIIEYTKGLGGTFKYQPAFGERGSVVCFYAEVKIAGVEVPLWDVFTPEQIKALRRGKVGPSGSIADPERWMERKTALKQVLKLAPKTSRLDMAIRSDELTGSELTRARGMDIQASIESDGPTGDDYVEGEYLGLGSQGPGDAHETVMVTSAQLKELAALFKREKTDDGATQVAWCAQIVRRDDLAALKDLTRDDADLCIADLKMSVPGGASG